jgi:hypothetical protein
MPGQVGVTSVFPLGTSTRPSLISISTGTILIRVLTALLGPPAR